MIDERVCGRARAQGRGERSVAEEFDDSAEPSPGALPDSTR